jgi:hypothetical protein
VAAALHPPGTEGSAETSVAADASLSRRAARSM